MAATDDAEAVQADRPPRNRIEFKIEGHCGSLERLREALMNIEWDLREKERDGVETVSIASSAGWSLTVWCNLEQTDEKYKTELQAWFERTRKR